MAEEVLVVLTTWPDVAKAREAARVLIEERLAACANIVPGIESIYRWEGKIETAGEVLMILKSVIGRYVELETRIKSLHPYEAPEILGVPVNEGFLKYLRWVQDCCNG